MWILLLNLLDGIDGVSSELDIQRVEKLQLILPRDDRGDRDSGVQDDARQSVDHSIDSTGIDVIGGSHFNEGFSGISHDDSFHSGVHYIP